MGLKSLLLSHHPPSHSLSLLTPLLTHSPFSTTPFPPAPPCPPSPTTLFPGDWPVPRLQRDGFRVLLAGPM